MQYKLYRDGLKLSRLGMGVMRLPVLNGDDSKIDYSEAKKIIDQCMKSGINYYDTAYIYHEGKSEEFIGRALAEYPRNSYYIADKYYLPANPNYKDQFSQQLERLQMNYIDFYLLHGLQDNFMDEILNNGCISYFDALKKQGKIKYLGFSYHGSMSKLPEVLEAYQWDFAQIQINYYDWYFGDAKALYDILGDKEIPIIVMEPVYGGLLANLKGESGDILKEISPDRSQASWAMRWVKDLDNVQVVLSGMSDANQIQDNLNTFDDETPLTEEEHEQIKKVAKIQNSLVDVGCTDCKYCCSYCPEELDIPGLLKAYNESKIGGEWRLAGLEALPKDKLPSACSKCYLCIKHCPQKINIPEHMEKLAKILK